MVSKVKQSANGDISCTHQKAALILQTNITTVLSCSISIAYHKAKNSTIAIVFGLTEDESWHVVETMKLQSITSHWMALLLAVLDAHGHGWTGKVQSNHEHLREIEQELKMRLWLDHKEGQENNEDLDLKKLDLLGAHKSLNSIFVQHAMYTLVCETRLGLIRRLQRYCDKNSDGTGLTTEVCAHAKSRLEYLESWFEGIQARTVYINRRAETQLQAVWYTVILTVSRPLTASQVSSLVSQRDSANSSEIARLSRDDNASTREIAIAAAKDSATMRIIAYVTLAFLPAKFVAVSDVRAYGVHGSDMLADILQHFVLRLQACEFQGPGLCMALALLRTFGATDWCCLGHVEDNLETEGARAAGEDSCSKAYQ